MSKFRRGDKVEASEEYKEHIRENDSPDAPDLGYGPGVFDSFVVSKVKSGPVYDKNANGYHIGGWINDDLVYGENGVRHPASRLKHSSNERAPEPPKKKSWFW